MVGGTRVRLFGGVSVDDATAPPGKARELLGYLLIHRARHHDRAALARMLWPEATPAAGRKHLRQALWKAGKAVPLVSDPSSVGVDAPAIWLDVVAFEHGCAAAGRGTGERLDAQQASELATTVELYRGDLLADWPQDWCCAERDRLQLLHLAALEQLVGYCRAHRLSEQGVGYATEILSRDPAHENAHYALMWLYHATGRRTMALRQYHCCRTALDREFGVAPSPRTTALHEQIRADRPLDARREARPAPRHVASAVAHRRLDEIQEALRDVRQALPDDVG